MLSLFEDELKDIKPRRRGRYRESRNASPSSEGEFSSVRSN